MDEVKIMIINDSMAIRLYLEEVINSFEDCKVINSSSNGKIALLYLKRTKPDIILLDLEMPQIDGLTFLENINGEYNIPVIVMSVYAKDDSAVLDDAIKAGAVDYIAPPIDDTELQKRKFKTTLRSKISKAKLLKLESKA